MGCAVRQIRIEGNIAYVPLTKGYEAVIDAEDVPLVAGHNWYAFVSRNTVYAARTGPRPEKRMARMHRVIMGEPEGLEIDHRDGDGLNNRRANLRAATTAQNARNKCLAKNSTTGLKGVSWHKRDRKWHARINLNGKRSHLGLFDNPQAAAQAYAKASLKFHGEFGRTA